MLGGALLGGGRRFGVKARRVCGWRRGGAAYERPYEPEIALIARHLPLAKTGDSAALQRLIRLVDGAYITSAEGAERLNAIYLDLLVEQPSALLSMTDRQEHRVREKFVDQLLRPVNGKFLGQTLLAL